MHCSAQRQTGKPYFINEGPQNERGVRMDDREIIELFNKRSERALDECRANYGAYLRRVALNITGSERDAEECEADAYLAAWRAIPPEKPRSLRAWLARCARNTALGRLEHDTAAKRGSGEAAAVLDELAECVPAPGSVGERLDAAELERAIDAFLLAQDGRSRRVFVQRCFDCEAVPEIARRNDMTEQAVRSLLHRTRKKLRAYLESEELI